MSGQLINGHKRGMCATDNRVKSACTVDQGAFLRGALVRMIRRLTPNPALREDLLQEAMVHLWLTQTRRPHQTRSWYLQSCRFHLQHYLNSGRSIDSGKRWRDQMPLTDHSEDEENAAEPGDGGNSVVNSVSVREIMSLLSLELTRQERAVLECLADGLGPREIGRKLQLSHTMVIRHRRKIAAVFTRLELPYPGGSLQTAVNGSPRVNGNGKHHPGREGALAAPSSALT
jgi:RNA polymerase sigma factor (sigma-70 family)